MTSGVAVMATAVSFRSQREHQNTHELPALAVGVATAIDIGAVALLIAGPLTMLTWGMALTLHLGATASLLLARGLPASRRSLLIAFGLTLPIVGPAAAVLSLARGGRSELELPMPEDADDEPLPDPMLIREVGELLPAPEALLVAGVEERRAMLFALGRRADAEAIALLRWALTASSAELGLEAALALEDMSIAFEKRLDAHRKKLAPDKEPTHLDALEAANCITNGFEVGILDAPRIEIFATEARRHYDLARQLDPSAAAEAAVGQARLELAILRPDLALELLDRALPGATAALRDELHRLRAEAVMRSHDLPWEGASILATYRRPLPSRAATRVDRRARVLPPTRKRQIG
jgi:hypothetical protein